MLIGHLSLLQLTNLTLLIICSLGVLMLLPELVAAQNEPMYKISRRISTIASQEFSNFFS